METKKILIATVIVFLLVWLVFAKWGWFVYFANLIRPQNMDFSKKYPKMQPPELSKQLSENLHYNKMKRYRVLTEIKARDKKIATTKLQYRRLRKAMPGLYSDNSILTKEFRSCVVDDYKIMDMYIEQYKTAHLYDTLYIKNLPDQQISSVKSYYSIIEPELIEEFKKIKIVEI